jgi:hypothetical protein
VTEFELTAAFRCIYSEDAANLQHCFVCVRDDAEDVKVCVCVCVFVFVQRAFVVVYMCFFLCSCT